MLAAPLTVADWRRWAATTVCERQAAHSAHSNLSTEKISNNSTIFGFCCQSTSVNLQSTDWALPIHTHWYYFKTSATKLYMQPFSSTCFSWTQPQQLKSARLSKMFSWVQSPDHCRALTTQISVHWIWHSMGKIAKGDILLIWLSTTHWIEPD